MAEGDGGGGVRKRSSDADRPPPIPPRPSFTFTNRPQPQPRTTTTGQHANTDPQQASASAVQQRSSPPDTFGIAPSFQATTSSGGIKAMDDDVDDGMYVGKASGPVSSGTVLSQATASGGGAETADSDNDAVDSTGKVTSVSHDAMSEVGGVVKNAVNNVNGGKAAPVQLTSFDEVKIADDSGNDSVESVKPASVAAPVLPPRLRSKRSADDLIVADKASIDDEPTADEVKCASVDQTLEDEMPVGKTTSSAIDKTSPDKISPVVDDTSVDETLAQAETLSTSVVTSSDSNSAPSSAAVCDEVFLTSSEDAQTELAHTEGTTEAMRLSHSKSVAKTEATEPVKVADDTPHTETNDTEAIELPHGNPLAKTKDAETSKFSYDKVPTKAQGTKALKLADDKLLAGSEATETEHTGTKPDMDSDVADIQVKVPAAYHSVEAGHDRDTTTSDEQISDAAAADSATQPVVSDGLETTELGVASESVCVGGKITGLVNVPADIQHRTSPRISPRAPVARLDSAFDYNDFGLDPDLFRPDSMELDVPFSEKTAKFTRRTPSPFYEASLDDDETGNLCCIIFFTVSTCIFSNLLCCDICCQ